MNSDTLLNQKAISGRDPTERGDRFWIRIYIGVVVFAALVIAALWLFSRYFSS